MPDLMQMMKDAAEAVPAIMPGPDSDWIPALCYEDNGGLFHTQALQWRELLPDGVAAAVREVKSTLECAAATQAVLVLPTYFKRLDQQSPKPIERVLLTHVTRDGVECEAARVLRSGGGVPRLGQWDVYAVDADVGPGVFVDAMREAIG